MAGTNPTLRAIAAVAAGVLVALVAGCGSESEPSLADAQASSPDGGTCGVVVQRQPSGGHLHTAADCDPVTYASNPPSSGTHYPDWAAYKTYAAPVPWGFLVHCLEHGAIVIVYNCANGCPDEVAQAQALIDGLAPDSACADAAMKIVLAPDPTLDVRWAASAWTWTLRADCFDGGAFASFIADHYEGPDTEAACQNGVDWSQNGWCP